MWNFLTGHHDNNDDAASSPADGSAAVGLQQPVLKPSDWFLTKAELTYSRGGVARNDLEVFSTNNHVTTFASSDGYYKYLLDDLESDSVESVWMTGWSLNHLVPFDPKSDKYEDTSLKAIFERAVLQRGVHVRALVWANITQRAENLASAAWMNSLGTQGGGSATMLFDDRLPHTTSSHHQKCVIIKRKAGDWVAFMGGVDITQDRWDTLAHDQKELREKRGIKVGSDGWLDAALRLEGPSAHDIAMTFAARWNSSFKLTNSMKDDLLDFENPEDYPHVPHPAPYTIANAVVDTSPTAVQIVRTFSPYNAQEMHGDFAPKGEVSLLQARAKAIRMAKNFVYIEDQYFFYMPQLMDALKHTMSTTNVRVVVVIQRPGLTNESKYSGGEELVYNMARPLMDAFPGRIQMFTTKLDRNLYIHTKLVIVDDVFLSIGSANWNRRSTTSDSELGASIVDTKLVDVGHGIRVGVAVREFRLLKFCEMTSRSVDTLRKLSIPQLCDLMDKAATEKDTILDPLQVEDKWQFVLFTEQFALRVVDPDDLNDPNDDEEKK